MKTITAKENQQRRDELNATLDAVKEENKIKNTQNHNEWITYIEDRPFNDKRYYISNQKIKDLGWTIEINFEDGINELLK